MLPLNFFIFHGMETPNNQVGCSIELGQDNQTVYANTAGADETIRGDQESKMIVVEIPGAQPPVLRAFFGNRRFHAQIVGDNNIPSSTVLGGSSVLYIPLDRTHTQTADELRLWDRSESYGPVPESIALEIGRLAMEAIGNVKGTQGITTPTELLLGNLNPPKKSKAAVHPRFQELFPEEEPSISDLCEGLDDYKRENAARLQRELGDMENLEAELISFGSGQDPEFSKIVDALVSQRRTQVGLEAAQLFLAAGAVEDELAKREKDQEEDDETSE